MLTVLAAAAAMTIAAPATATPAPSTSAERATTASSDEARFYVRPSALVAEPVPELGGLRAKVLSRNRTTGRLAIELSLPPGTRERGARRLDDRSVELVVLEGSVMLGKDTLGPRDFAYAPAGRARPGLETRDGARVLVFFDPAPADPTIRRRLQEIGSYVTRYAESRWNPGSLSQSAGFDLKLEIQHLKKDPLSGARTWLVRLAPPVRMPFEVHSVPEEAYVLEGRFAQPECMPDGMRTGVYKAGDYFYRPAGIPHSGPGAGPIEPTTFLMRSPADLDVTFYAKCEAAQPSERVTTQATMRREIAALLERWTQLRNAGRWDELGQLLADDPRFAWVEFGRVSMPSHASALSELAKAQGQPARTFTELGETVIEPLGTELALVRSSFKIRAVDREAEAQAANRSAQSAPELSARAAGIDRSGVMTAVLIFKDRRWQFLQVNFSQAR